MANGAVRELVTKIKFVIDKASESKANKAASDLKKKLQSIDGKAEISLNTSQANATLQRFKSQMQALNQTGKALADNVAATTSNMKIGAETSKASNALKDVKKQVDKVSATASKVKVNADTGKATSALQRLKRTLNDIKTNVNAKVNVDSGNANSALARIKGQLNSLSGKVTTAYVEVKQKGKAVGDGVKKTGQALADNGGTIAATGAAMVAPISLPVKEAIDFESAMADVRKVVDFDTPEQFKEMAKDISNLSTVIPMTKEQIASIVAAGGQSNIARQDLLSFAEAAGKMGVAFDISAEQAGESMAQIKTMFGMTLPQVFSLSDAINYLGNNSAASAPKILNVMQRVGAMGKLAGFSEVEVAALGSAITGIGVAPEVAATGIQNMSKALTGGYAPTKASIAAFEKLGLTVDGVKKSMQADAKGTLIDVLKRISALDKTEQTSTLVDIFRSESLDSVAPLLGNIKMLEDSFNLVGDSAKYAGSMQAEFDARNATTANSLQLLKNTLGKVAGDIGEAFLPVIKALAEGLKGLTKAFGDFAKEHPKLVGGIVAGVAAIGAALVALGSAGLVLSGLMSAGTALLPVFKAIGAAIQAIIGAGFLPLAAVIAAVASAIYFVQENWETVVEWFRPGIDSMMDGIEQFRSAWESLQPFIAVIIPPLKAIATVIGGVIVGAVSYLWRIFAAAFNAIAGLINWVAGLLGGLGETIQWIAGGLAGLIEKAQAFIGMRGAINGTNEAMIQGWMNRGGSTTNQTQNISVGTIQVPKAEDVGKGIGGLAEVTPFG